MKQITDTWYEVSERLPKEDDFVIVSERNGDMTVCYYRKNCFFPCYTDRYGLSYALEDVEAWMIPERYKPKTPPKEVSTNE